MRSEFWRRIPRAIGARLAVMATTKPLRLRASLVAAALAAVTAAHADAASGHAAGAIGEPSPGAGFEPDAVQAEIARFKTAPISLREALSIAQSRHRGSRAVDAAFDGETVIATYHVRMKRGGQLWEDIIDAYTGSTIKTEVMSALDDLAKSDREALARLRSVRQELSDAVIVAERTTGGKAISAGLTTERGRLEFVIVCVAGGDLKQVMLEPPRTAAPLKR